MKSQEVMSFSFSIRADPQTRGRRVLVYHKAVLLQNPVAKTPTNTMKMKPCNRGSPFGFLHIAHRMIGWTTKTITSGKPSPAPTVSILLDISLLHRYNKKKPNKLLIKEEDGAILGSLPNSNDWKTKHRGR